MIPFMRFKWPALISSILLIGYTYYETNFVHSGFAQGIDFAGGIKIEIEANEKISSQILRNFFTANNIEATITKVGEGKDSLFRLEIDSRGETKLQDLAQKYNSKNPEAKLSDAIEYIRLLINKKIEGEINIISNSLVGPSVGPAERRSAINVLSIATILIIIYVAFRFRLQFAAGALMALLHDLALTLGLIGMLQIPLSKPVIAALLTILGYSINDTIVVFDRIRENMQKNIDIPWERLLDRSINESMSRTIVTSLTTLLAISSVYFLGGEGLDDMAAVLLLGVVIGTYSSSFIAAPVISIWNQLTKRKTT